MRGLINAAKIRQAQSQKSSPSRDISRILTGGIERESEMANKKLQEENLKKEMKRQKRINKMAQNNSERREAWIYSVQNDDEFIEKYQKGSVPIVNPALHKFRDFSYTGITQSGQIQMNTSDKIKYKHQDFQDKQPHLVNNFRDRKNNMEVSGLQFKYQPQTSENRVAQQIQNNPPLSTEPLNTLLFSMPKWREYNKSKWKDQKDFNAQKTSSDKTWDPIENTSPRYCEPFIDKIVEFRPNFEKKKQSVIIASSTKMSDLPYVQQLTSKERYKVFDATIPKDCTWKDRLNQSSSLRQRAHLNMSIKIKEKESDIDAIYNYPIGNLSQEKVSAQDETDNIQITATPDTKVKQFFNFQANIKKPSSPKEDDDNPLRQNQLSQILSENYNTPKNLPKNALKSPVKLREQFVNLQNMKLDSAAKLLNNSFNKSFTNSWQYQVIQPVQNKQFQARIELNDSHILHELDKVKTYYGSIVGKISVRSQISSPMSFDKRDRRQNNEILFTPINQQKRVNLNSPDSSIDLNLTQNIIKRRQVRSTATSPLSESQNVSRSGFNKEMNSTQYGGFSYKGNTSNLSQKLGNTTIKEAINKYFDKVQQTKQTQY
eukprot:403373393